MTDFMSSAEWWADRAIVLGAEDDALASATLAGAYATLALAEQTRIANLIALTKLGGRLYLAGHEGAEALTHRVPDPNTPGDVGYALRPDIAGALGVDHD